MTDEELLKEMEKRAEAYHDRIKRDFAIDILKMLKAEIKTNRDEWIKGQDAEWYTYDRCLVIIENHISELKGENK